MTAPGDLHKLCEWAKTWLPTLAPADLPGPLYIINNRLPSALDSCTGEDVDLAYRSEIGHRWKGRGVAILLDIEKFQLDTRRLREVNHADDSTIRAMEGYVVKAVLRLLLHELAHVVGWLPLPTATPAIQQQARQVIDAAIWNPATTADPRLPAPFANHGADFVRAALHLHYRSRRQGVKLPLIGLAAGLRYLMAPIESYRQSLNNEPWRLRDASFRTIATTPPPKRFAELWQHDIAHWLRWCAAHGELSDDIFRNAVWAANVLPGKVTTKEKLVAIVAA